LQFQLYLLQMQSEKVFGQYDKLRGQIVVLSHAEAVNDLVGAKDAVTGYFSSAPYTEIALADGRVHRILSGSDVIDGKASFLILGASKGYIAAHPKIPEAVAKAIDEAARIIHDDPRRAAEIYLVHEPSRTLDAAALEKTVAEFNIAVRPGTFDHTILDDCRTEGISPAKTHWARALDTPPFYAYPLRPGITFTYLGLKVDDTTAVRFGNRPSPNLFVAGEMMAGNVLGKGYTAGVGMSIGTAFGRIAGTQAAAAVLKQKESHNANA